MIKFGTSGFRAIIAEDFNKENIQKITQALSKIIKQQKSTQPVVVGYDRRFMSDKVAIWISEVLAGNKITVKLYNNCVPSPTVMYAVKSENLDYGFIVTASHNPYEYNGIKITVKGGADSSVELTSQIEKIANSNLRIKTMDIIDARKAGLVLDYDNTKEYFKHLSKFVSKEIKNNKLKVIFYAMHGVTAEYAPVFAKTFKINKFMVVNDSVDPYFEHKLPAPEEPFLEKFKREVVKGKYHIGVAVDGDGDRLGVVDENGVYYDNNILIAIVYYYLVKYRGLKGDLVKNRAGSILLDKLAESLGYKCYEVPTGFKYVSAKMKEVDALLGGESTGGMTMRNYIPSKDCFFSIALILDAMVNIKKPLSEIAKEVKDSCGYISTYINDSVTVRNKKKLQKALMKKVPNFSYKPVSKTTNDGTKFVFEDGSWALLRFSGTENVLRYTLEFPTEIECERNLKALQNFIKQYGN
ncbi:MAG: phosphoglucomutase/phosphomannomutase family protein [Christensenellales bacterium]